MEAIIVNTLTGLGIANALVWTWQLLGTLLHRNRIPRLVDLPVDTPDGGWPSLTVAFAARNEQVAIEPATRSLLSQDYPDLTVIGVDDRSTDQTGTILDRIAAEDPKLHVIHVRELSAGWLGKNHALEQAVRSTLSDWLLLTDADVVFSPQALRKAVAFAVRSKADHVSVLPEVPTETMGERLYMTMFGLMFAMYAPLWLVENPRRRAFLGVGAFNLVRRESLRSIGGFQHLALSVDDDMRLGQALKAAGFRIRLLQGMGAVSVRWHVGLRGMIGGMEKNFFVGVNYNPLFAVLCAALFAWLGSGSHLGLFIGPWWSRLICAVGVISICAVTADTGRQAGVRWYYGLLTPLGALVIDYALLRSMWFTLRRGGVQWREHHYPLRQLREHMHARNAWTRQMWRTARANRHRPAQP